MSAATVPTLRASIRAAVAAYAEPGLSVPERRAARARRDELLVFAYERNASIRQLCAVSGIGSTSTVHDIVRRAKRIQSSVLDDPTPEALLAEQAEAKA